MYHTSLPTFLFICCIICSLNSENQRNYYDVLDVGRAASSSDIKIAYNEKKQFAQSSSLINKLKLVYDVLSDPLKRLMYDVYGEDGLDKEDEEDDEYYYKILGLKPGATDKEIKKAYRRLSIMFHPDKAGNSGAMKPQFMKVIKAYDKLYNNRGSAGGFPFQELQDFGSAGSFHRFASSDSFGHTGRAVPFASMPPSKNNVGFSVGGAKDITNFRNSIENNLVPLKSSITHEGIYYDYFFDTGSIGNDTTQTCTQLFCPTYSSAVVNPANINNEESENEYYLSVGFNSGIKQDDFKRKPLNLVIALDISGSMSGAMKGGCDGLQDGSCTNLNVAKNAIVGLFKHLDSQDRIGIVTFDHNAYVINKLESVGKLNMNDLSQQIKNLRTAGATNMETGYKQGTKLYDDAEIDWTDLEYENRLIFLTDAMPNTGRTDKKDLLSLTKNNADKRIYTTFIGVGLNFNSDLIEAISKIRGGNYYSVNSYKEFMKRMDDEFEFMVTPLVFNMSLSLKSTRNMYTIDKIYGSPDSDVSTGHLMKIDTLFPSPPNDDGEIKGGITLLKLKLNKTNSNNEKDIAKLQLLVNYEDRNGEKHENFVSVIFSPVNTHNGIFDNNGIRKAVLLSQYVSLVKEWIDSERQQEVKVNMKAKQKAINISSEFKQKFETFLLYFQQEMKQIGDETLQKEVDILKRLSGQQTTNKIEL